MPALPEPRIHVPRPKMLVIAPARIRMARQAKRLSLRELAIRCDCSHQAIFKIEAGMTKFVDDDLAIALSRWLDLPLEEVFAAQTASRTSVVANRADTSCGGEPA